MTVLSDLQALGGYRILYRPGTHCPCCDGQSWHIGRSSAECAACATALPLAPVESEEPCNG